MTFDFNKISNFHLASGSHDQPNERGDICVNEAAIVAAGFKYKKVESASDCPPCFSRPIAAYAIRLNDSMPDDLRQELLMPFVMRLSGTADTKENEIKRAQFMALENCCRIMSEMCIDALKLPDLAQECRDVKTLKEAEDICRNKVRKAAYAAAAYAAAAAAYAANAAADADADAADAAAAYAAATAAYADAAYAAAAYAANAAADADAADADAADADAANADAANADAAYAAYAAAYAADAAYAAYAADAKRKYFTIATQILYEAILMGNHTELDVYEIVPRLEQAKKQKVSA
jgi:hypothetical protein